ncbi:PREDICTED: E3 ubiquitin-protein ligase NHLRC1 [Gavialis gangeticus]|uniref:E3 ubiquitin-protein ligase NHLRC1 n=1 Tax=Gavialis gangeticus TaxID=94835 RepID=UPI00092E25CD|nr:PREDICTED: E3 ubiquitin-protein ligase NHLRC1 [Gavialis gangeticus]
MSAKDSEKMQIMMELVNETEISLLECKVCFEKYSHQKQHRPRNLPCGHIICLDCVCSLAHPRNFRLECPFCRRVCKSSETSDCLPLLHLTEILRPATNIPSTSGTTAGASDEGIGSTSPGLTFSLSFGGWGMLINPTGIAVCQRSSCVVVAHDGKKRIKLFGLSGSCIQQFGERGNAGNDIKYPLDVTVTLDGHVVVTDSGDQSVKVFDFDGRGKLVIRGSFHLPWGLDITPENKVILTDANAGALYHLTADFKKGELKKIQKTQSDLCNPREVAVSQLSGVIAVIEHLLARGPNYSSTRMKIFNADMTLIGQLDSFGLNLFFPSKIYVTAVTFDREGHIIVADVYNQAVLCLGKPEEFPVFKPIITQGLAYPVALTYTANNSLIVLDNGDHSVKIYTTS